MGSIPDGFVCDCRPETDYILDVCIYCNMCTYIYIYTRIYMQMKCVNVPLACSGFEMSILIFIAK
jgi:hypothetical protein